MKPGECPTPGCTETQGSGGFDYDHLGCVRSWCGVHGRELLGVRKRITALLAQVKGLNRILGTPNVFNQSTIRAQQELHQTLREQGALLIQLIKRERELTGAAEPGK